MHMKIFILFLFVTLFGYTGDDCGLKRQKAEQNFVEEDKENYNSNDRSIKKPCFEFTSRKDQLLKGNQEEQDNQEDNVQNSAEANAALCKIQQEKDERLWRDIKLILMTPEAMGHIATQPVIDYLVRHINCPKRQLIMACALYEMHHGLPDYVKSSYLKEKINEFSSNGLRYVMGYAHIDPEAALIQGYYYLGVLEESEHLPDAPDWAKKSFTLFPQDIYCQFAFMHKRYIKEEAFKAFLKNHFIENIWPDDIIQNFLSDNAYKKLCLYLNEYNYYTDNYNNYFNLERKIKLILK